MPEPDDVTEAFARALFESHVQLASEEIAKLSYDFDRIDRTFAAAHEETDRSCAITIFALIDELICDLFLLHVNPAFGQSRRRLFDEFGILPTASRRLQMLFALNWIDRDTFHDLNLLRKIRNEFAHRASVRSFEEDPIKGYMASFRTPYADVLDRALSAVGLTFKGMPADQIKQIVTKKTRYFFLLMSCIVLRYAAFQTLVTPIALRHRLKHTSIPLKEEGILNDLHLMIARILLKIIEDASTAQNQDQHT